MWMCFRLCAVALLCSVHAGFAQAPPDATSLIGKWELVSVDGKDAAIPAESIEITAKTVEIRQDCNRQSYTYTLENGEITAKPPALMLLTDCDDSRTKLIQGYIVAAVTHSKIQLSGDTLQLTPLPRPSNGELVFLAKLEFRRKT
jgi:hypothetical protein